MSVACVINTCALAPHAGTTLSSGKQPYAERAWLMRNVILPAYTKWFPGLFDEVVVVGEYEEGEGYAYIRCPSVYRNCADALLQRQAGFDALKGNHSWVLFQHDDHLWDPANVIDPRTYAQVLSPSRWTRTRGGEEPLNDGFNMAFDVSAGYVNGHASLMKPHAFRNGFGWTKVPPVFTWDRGVTQQLQQLEIPYCYNPQLRVWDLERNARPWE